MNAYPATLAQALAAAAALGVDRLDSQLLLLHTLRKPAANRAWLLAHDGDAIDAPHWQDYAALCRRRLTGEPVAYLTGRKEFYGLDLQVDARVLVPRPDTETLVEWALEVIGGIRQPRVLDLGTGSGAIALAIKQQRPDADVHAVEASAGALEVAQGNARALNLDVSFRQGSWFEGVSGHYHAIVSNPPYVAAGDPHLAALAHEPASALASGPDGLDDIRQIVHAAPRHLHPQGWLLLEHGFDQAAAVRALLAAGLAGATSRTDLAGIERCSGANLPALG
ncbi:MAG: peptide chain release factor N(5)-glutamine methyltransferase [Burkholderiales bacterium]|nr:MAG: peptide chain release factor N(5)-glutamine methyltransferase [Burkholderiales bacterium]